MLSKSLIEMVKGRWREFKREPSAMFFVIFMPIMWMLILGLAFSKPQVKPAHLALTLSQKPAYAAMEQKIVQILEAQAPAVSFRAANLQEVELGMKRGEIQLALEVAGDQSVVLRYDPSNPDSEKARLLAEDVLQKGFGRQVVLSTKVEPITTPGGRYIDFLIPGLLALSLWTTSLFGTGMTLVAHRRENLLKRYRATPMRPYEYILSHIIGRYMIFGVEFATVMLTGVLLFDFHVSGSWWEYFAVGLLATAAFASLAILCGARLKNTATYNGLNNILTLPMMLLAGIWFSRSNFPSWLKSVTDYLPLTACVDALRKIALEGSSLSQLGFEMAVLSAYALFGSVIAKQTFKWY